MLFLQSRMMSLAGGLTAPIEIRVVLVILRLVPFPSSTTVAVVAELSVSHKEPAPDCAKHSPDCTPRMVTSFTGPSAPTRRPILLFWQTSTSSRLVSSEENRNES